MRGGRLDVTDGANRTFGGFGGAERVSLRQAHDRHPPERGGGAAYLHTGTTRAQTRPTPLPASACAWAPVSVPVVARDCQRQAGGRSLD